MLKSVKNAVLLLITASCVLLSAQCENCFSKDISLERLRFRIDLLYKKYQLTGSEKVKESLLYEIDNSLKLLGSDSADDIQTAQTQSDSSKRRLGMRVTQFNDRIEIKSIVPGGNADRSGLKKGDVITQVMNTRVRTIEQLEKLLDTNVQDSLYRFTVIRNGKSIVRKVKY